MSSAGTRALIGHAIHADAAAVLEVLGGNPANFSARQLTGRIAADTDVILTMTRGHQDAVLSLAPRLLRRTFLLTEFANLFEKFGALDPTELSDLRPHLGRFDAEDIPDPIGQSPETFEVVGAQIAELIGSFVDYCASAPVLPSNSS